MADDDRLSITLKARASPTHRALLQRLAEGEATVSEVAAPFDISLPAISRHLKAMEEAGLISRGRDAQWRSRHLGASPVKEVAAWVTDYQAFSESRFDRLDDHLRAMKKESDH